MPFYFFIWTSEIEDHIAQHGITIDEFEAIVQSPEWTEPSRTSERTIAFGELRGRLVACVYEQFDDDYIEPVTAYFIED